MRRLSCARSMHPAEVVCRPDLVLVDLRCPTERSSAQGFLAPSLSLPLSAWTEMQRTLDLLETLDDVKGIVVHCTSGGRSKKLRATFADETSLPVFDLEGGIRAWEASGLPVCRVRAEPVDRVFDGVLDYRRDLLARVSGERAAVPCPLLSECFRRARARWDAPTVESLDRVLNWIGVATFREGGHLRDVAEDLVGMYMRLRTLDKRRA